jgi:hypothetical protein
VTSLYLQYLQSTLTKWRSANRWADDIPFEQFPERYKAEIELAAHINQEAQ